MRRIMAGAVAALSVTALLSGCAPGPNAEAVAAAEDYAEELTGWSGELANAVEGAKTATSAEWDALGDGQDLPYQEVGVGELLEDAPELAEFDSDAVAHTPGYLLAADVAERVDALARELTSLEPAALKRLRAAGYDSYWPLADLYYNTLGGPAAERRSADAEATELLFADDPDFERFDEIQRSASLSFLEQRLELVGTAIDGMHGTSDISGDPIIPEDGLGASIGAFIVDWLEEEQPFLERAIEQTSSWSVVVDAYDSFWGHEFLNEVFYAPLDHAAALRPAFAAQVAELSDALTGALGASPAPTASPVLPAIGDPYRQILRDGYLPWGDPAASEEHTQARLWMLWRIRELERTPEAAYAVARAAILEELNRSREEGTVVDFRPGGDRLLVLIEEYTSAFEPEPDVAVNERMLTGLQELVEFGEALGALPSVPPVSRDFDAVVAVFAEANAAVADTIESNADEYDQYFALADLSEVYADRLFEAASASLGLLDDDAQAEALIAEAIDGTAPSAAAATPSPTSTPSP